MKVMSHQQFKANFSTGDIICRDRMGIPLLITAIGQSRFLYICMVSNRTERVAQQQDWQSRWRIWNPSKHPDSQYIYLKSTKPDQWSLTVRQKIEVDLSSY